METEKEEDEKEREIGIRVKSGPQQNLGLWKELKKTKRKHIIAIALLNHPANLAAFLPVLARFILKSESEVARACFENARSVFCCAAAPHGDGGSGDGEDGSG